MARADRGHNGGHRSVFGFDRDDLILHQLQTVLLFERMLHIRPVFNAVSLCAQRMHRWAFAAVEHAVLDTSGVRCPRHLAAQCIDLTHQMPLCRTANSRIARHIADSIQIDRKTRGFHSKTCSGKRRFNPRMPRADHDNVKSFGWKNRHESSSFFVRHRDS